MATEEQVHQIWEGIRQAFNNRDVDRFLSYYADDLVFQDVGLAEVIRDKATFGKRISRWWPPFPDAKMTVEKVLASGDWAAVQFRFTGTHQGDLTTPFGVVPATGRPVEHRACAIVRIAGGKIQEDIFYGDHLAMMQQLGALSLLAKAG